MTEPGEERRVCPNLGTSELLTPPLRIFQGICQSIILHWRCRTALELAGHKFRVFMCVICWYELTKYQWKIFFHLKVTWWQSGCHIGYFCLQVGFLTFGRQYKVIFVSNYY